MRDKQSFTSHRTRKPAEKPKAHGIETPKHWALSLECVHPQCFAPPQERFEFPIPLCKQHLIKVLSASSTVSNEAKRQFAKLNSHAPVPIRKAQLTHDPIIYYVKFGDRIKIGTTSNLNSRLVDLPHDEVLATEPGSYRLETTRHRQFASCRIKGEWFRPTPELLAHIDRLKR